VKCQLITGEPKMSFFCGRVALFHKNDFFHPLLMI